MKRRQFLALLGLAGAALALSPLGVLGRDPRPTSLMLVMHSFKEGKYTIHTDSSMDWFFMEKEDKEKFKPILVVKSWREIGHGIIEVAGEGGESFGRNDTLRDDFGNLYYVMEKIEGLISGGLNAAPRDAQWWRIGRITYMGEGIKRGSGR